ncbi:hypothetical protein OHC33_002614 [Knufia fluminis]|uniref:Uncharacterized protein n=1 Tax=Knufia fluminis TaxID=191047 RepID=A0AAN8EXS7_9EURO|nr:hypothetical protein OHC33_002614 [Knufia fluminis]
MDSFLPGNTPAGAAVKYLLVAVMSIWAYNKVTSTTDLATHVNYESARSWFGFSDSVVSPPPPSQSLHTYLPSDFLYGEYCLSTSFGRTEDIWPLLSEFNSTPQDDLFHVPGTDVAIWQCPNEDFTPPSTGPVFNFGLGTRVFDVISSLDTLHWTLLTLLLILIVAWVRGRNQNKRLQAQIGQLRRRISALNGTVLAKDADIARLRRRMAFLYDNLQQWNMHSTFQGVVISAKRAQICDLRGLISSLSRDAQQWIILQQCKDATIHGLRVAASALTNKSRAWKVLAALRKIVIIGKRADIQDLHIHMALCNHEGLLHFTAAQLRINAKANKERKPVVELERAYGRIDIPSDRCSMTQGLLKASRDDADRREDRLERNSREKYRLQRKYQVTRDAFVSTNSFMVEVGVSFANTKEDMVEDFSVPSCSLSSVRSSARSSADLIGDIAAMTNLTVAQPKTGPRAGVPLVDIFEDQAAPVVKLLTAKESCSGHMSSVQVSRIEDMAFPDTDARAYLAILLEEEAFPQDADTVSVSPSVQSSTESLTETESGTEERSRSNSDEPGSPSSRTSVEFAEVEKDSDPECQKTDTGSALAQDEDADALYSCTEEHRGASSSSEKSTLDQDEDNEDDVSAEDEEDEPKDDQKPDKGDSGHNDDSDDDDDGAPDPGSGAGSEPSNESNDAYDSEDDRSEPPGGSADSNQDMSESNNEQSTKDDANNQEATRMKSVQQLLLASLPSTVRSRAVGAVKVTPSRTCGPQAIVANILVLSETFLVPALFLHLPSHYFSTWNVEDGILSVLDIPSRRFCPVPRPQPERYTAELSPRPTSILFVLREMRITDELTTYHTESDGQCKTTAPSTTAVGDNHQANLANVVEGNNGNDCTPSADKHTMVDASMPQRKMLKPCLKSTAASTRPSCPLPVVVKEVEEQSELVQERKILAARPRRKAQHSENNNEASHENAKLSGNTCRKYSSEEDANDRKLAEAYKKRSFSEEDMSKLSASLAEPRIPAASQPPSTSNKTQSKQATWKPVSSARSKRSRFKDIEVVVLEAIAKRANRFRDSNEAIIVVTDLSPDKARDLVQVLATQAEKELLRTNFSTLAPSSWLSTSAGRTAMPANDSFGAAAPGLLDHMSTDALAFQQDFHTRRLQAAPVSPLESAAATPSTSFGPAVAAFTGASADDVAHEAEKSTTSTTQPLFIEDLSDGYSTPLSEESQKLEGEFSFTKHPAVQKGQLEFIRCIANSGTTTVEPMTFRFSENFPASTPLEAQVATPREKDEPLQPSATTDKSTGLFSQSKFLPS